MAQKRNVEARVENNILTIQVDLSKDFGASESGKTDIIASTGGGIPVEGAEEAVRVNLSVYKYRARK